MFSSIQLLELFIVLCTAYRYRYAFSKLRSAFVNAQAKSGPVRPETVTRFSGAPFIALQAIVTNLVSVTYIFAVVGAGLRQPSWMNALALPEVVLGVGLEGVRKNVLRVLGCGITYSAMRNVTDSVFEHLGDQYHPIGRHEKSRVVQTGPYAWVRHPLYALALLDAALRSLVFWSYAPLFELVAIAIVFGIKIPIEEEIILQDDGTREEYRAYMRKVPARLVPYVW